MVPTEGALAYILQLNDLETLKGIDRCQDRGDGRVWLSSARGHDCKHLISDYGRLSFSPVWCSCVIKVWSPVACLPYIYAAWVLLISFPIDLNESQLQLDLVCNGKAVNVAMKLQISCSKTGEWNRYLIDRVWKGERAGVWVKAWATALCIHFLMHNTMRNLSVIDLRLSFWVSGDNRLNTFLTYVRGYLQKSHPTLWICPL